MHQAYQEQLVYIAGPDEGKGDDGIGKEAGADRFRYCDTLGTDDPITIYERIKALALATKFPIEMHCHNDLGMAEAVSIAGAQGAVESGIDSYVNTTVNGYGERCGNCDLVSTILALKFSFAGSRSISLSRQRRCRSMVMFLWSGPVLREFTPP